MKTFLKRIIRGLKRRFPDSHAGKSAYGLSPLQIYPEGVNYHDQFALAVARHLRDLVWDKDTSFASIGSCFAEEFSRNISAIGLHYPVYEENCWNFPVNWGRVYTIQNFAQIIDYSLLENYPIFLEQGKLNKTNTIGWLDPLRENTCDKVIADGKGDPGEPAEAQSDLQKHRILSRKALTQANILFITLGQNEGWVDHKYDIVWGRFPGSEYLKTERTRFTPKCFSHEENRNVLESALKTLFEHNRNLTVILTISPVPSFAVFSNESVITSSFASKCVLRSVAEEVIKIFPGKVVYFPSFEAVLTYNPRNYQADNRHVNPEVIQYIFNELRQTLLQTKAKQT